MSDGLIDGCLVIKPLSERLCKNCAFWTGERNGWAQQSGCRRHAPVAVESSTYRGQINTVWPQTNQEHWCGDWQEAQ